MKARELVAKNLQSLRLRSGRSQEALADEAEIDRAHIGRIERGEANPTLDLLDKLARALRINVAELFRAVRPNTRPLKPLKKGPK